MSGPRGATSPRGGSRDTSAASSAATRTSGGSPRVSTIRRFAPLLPPLLTLRHLRSGALGAGGQLAPTLNTRLRLGVFFVLVGLQRFISRSRHRKAFPLRSPWRRTLIGAESHHADESNVAEPKATHCGSLRLEGLTPEQIGDDAPLFGQGLGLDSVDALELVVAIEKKYRIRIKSHEVDKTSSLRSRASPISWSERRAVKGGLPGCR